MPVLSIGQAVTAEPRLDPPAECEGDISHQEHASYGHCHKCCPSLKQCSDCFLDDAYDARLEAL